MKNEFKHYTVMKNEVVDSLECSAGKVYVDATLGGGGHSELILKKISPSGILIAFDVDSDAINHARERLKDYNNLTIVQDSYLNIRKNLQNLNIEKITGGICFDLGASYHQLTCAERGFSFSKDAKLDMRFNKDSDFTAFDVVNSYSEAELVRIFSDYSQERFSKRIARNIVEKRAAKPIETTVELASLVQNSVPNIHTKIHPATLVFQAIRMEVNQELQNIKNTLNEVITLLDVGAIITVLSFHSGEDRIVKNIFRYHSSKCNCKPNDPVCKCEKPILELITKKPIMAGADETKENPPSRSAKLRVAKRI